MKEFSKAWISSKKPNKQRKYRFNAPKHIRGEFMNVHLSKDLRQKHGIRALRVRVGDKVRIMRGQFKKQEGKVEEVNLKSLKVYISKIEHVKRDGTKARYPLEPSNLLLVELNTDDRKRLAKSKAASKPAKNGSVKAEKPAKSEKPLNDKQKAKPKAVKAEAKTDKKE